MALRINIFSVTVIIEIINAVKKNSCLSADPLYAKKRSLCPQTRTQDAPDSHRRICRETSSLLRLVAYRAQNVPKHGGVGKKIQPSAET